MQSCSPNQSQQARLKEAPSRRILVVAPFTHQNGHFVTFPRDIACALDTNGYRVTLVHTRPFRTDLDWGEHVIERICLRDELESEPWWWQELWARFANYPSLLCLAWIIWKLRPRDYALALWTDFQAQPNVWPLAIARLLRLYRFRSAFFEHHPPEEEKGLLRLLPGKVAFHRARLAKLNMFVFSKALLNLWEARIGTKTGLNYVPHGLWPKPAPDARRNASRNALGIDQHARVLLVFGVQAIKRKHIDTLYEAVSSFSSDKRLMLIFAGASFKREPHPFSEWRQNNIDVRSEEGFIPEDKAEDYFYAADAIWANYRDFPGASGALLQAVGYGRLSITSSEGEIADLSRENNLGIAVEAPDAAHLKNALEEFVAMSSETQVGWEQHISSVAQQYAWPLVARAILAKLGLDEAMNRAP